MTTNKIYLRDKYRKLRSELSQDDIDDKSLAIANNISKKPIWHHHYFHIFLPILPLKEVNTEYILHILAGKDKEIVLSKSDFTTHEMHNVLLTDNTKIIVNSYGIPEPENGLHVPTDKIDVVFVPLLAFDVSGNRVGYGKGFYDKFLADCKPQILKIGLSFFDAEDKISDIFEGDIKLNFCITPAKVYAFD